LSERETSELREQFIAVLGHDLRSPLASIAAGARMLTKEDQKEAASEILGLMQKSVARMSALIDNVLERPILVRATTQDGKFELSVANAGEPILSEVMERLFQPFYRLAEQGSQQGLGLGLYIASEIARAHGGRIEVTSSPAETRFTFRTPLQESLMAAVSAVQKKHSGSFSA
jgi:signal transduction histidine kinase